MTFTQTQIDTELGVPAGWHAGNPDIYVYIDDANSVEKIRIPGSIVSISEDKQKVKVHAVKSEQLFNSVSINSANIKMRVKLN